MLETANQTRLNILLEKLRKELNVKKEVFNAMTIKLLTNTINNLQELEKEMV